MANPTLLNMPIARDGNKNAIPTTDNGTTGLLSQQYGWQLINAIPPQQGGKAVKREDFNGALYLLSNILFYAQKGWQWEFDETQNYFAGCTVKDTADGKTYVCIADVSASTIHPSNDTTHWKLSDLATKEDLANYLPLAGGAMTGNEISRNIDTSGIDIIGATDPIKGGWLALRGIDSSSGGLFALYAADGNVRKGFIGRADGTLEWNKNDLGGSAIVAKSIGTNGYVIRADGEIMQWGEADPITPGVAKKVTFPISFNGIPRVFVTPYTTSGQSSYPILYIADMSATGFKIYASEAVAGWVNWFAVGAN